MIAIWDTKGISIKNLTGHKEYISSIAFNEYYRYLVTGSFDKTIKLWDLNDYSII
jgi:WD40 repeat protein